MGYNGGCGVEYFRDWNQAVSGARQASSPSLLCALAFQHECEEEYRREPISLAGQFTDSSILSSIDRDDGRMHYETAKFYQSICPALQRQTTDTTTRDSGDDTFYNEEENNYICYQGLQAERGPDKTFSQYTTNTGHLGKCLIKINIIAIIGEYPSNAFILGDSETTDSSLAWSGMLSMKTSVSTVYLV